MEAAENWRGGPIVFLFCDPRIVWTLESCLMLTFAHSYLQAGLSHSVSSTREWNDTSDSCRPGALPWSLPANQAGAIGRHCEAVDFVCRRRAIISTKEERVGSDLRLARRLHALHSPWT